MTENPTFIHWRKSSRSSGGDNCVEIGCAAEASASASASAAATGRDVGVRDSKLGSRGPVLEFSSGEWAGFLAAAKTGRFDLS
jgi:hypothetical protein